MEIEREPLPESRRVFEVTSPDGSLTVSVWDDSKLHRFLPHELNELEYHGLLTVFDTVTNTYYLRDRVRLSRSTMRGEEPTDDEKQEWLGFLGRFLDK